VTGDALYVEPSTDLIKSINLQSSGRRFNLSIQMLWTKRAKQLKQKSWFTWELVTQQLLD